MRADNPTFDQAEATLAALERGPKALIFVGMSAATACFPALARAIMSSFLQMYWALRNWLATFATAWGSRSTSSMPTEPTRSPTPFGPAPPS